MVVSGVVPGRQFKLATGVSVAVYKGSAPAGKNKIVDASNPITVPSGWTTICVQNNDDKNPSVFLVAQV